MGEGSKLKLKRMVGNLLLLLAPFPVLHHERRKERHPTLLSNLDLEELGV